MSARMKRAAAIFGAALLASTAPASAQGVPVFDASNIAQAIEQVRQGVEMIERAQQQINALTGARGMSLLLNSATDIAAPGVAEDFPGLMEGAISGREILGNTTRIVASINRIKATFDLGGLSTFASSDLAQYRSLATLGGASLAAMATGEDSYARANEAMTRVDTLIPRIDANTDVKAAIDFNTRVQIEQTQVMNELLRVLAAQANAQGAQSLFNTRQEMASRDFTRGIGADGGTP
jgi:type IV secretion system protein VirB5